MPRLNAIVHSDQTVCLVGSGQVSAQTFSQISALCPILVAADGAAQAALDFGRVPDAVIGDFDSFPADLRSRIPADRLHTVPEQITTDFEKCLTHIDAPLILGVGFSGARLDHELACYNAIARHPDRSCILVGDHDLCFHAPPFLDLPVAPGTRVSLFPLTEITGRSEGLEWPLDGIVLSPVGRIGTSNTAQGQGVRVWMDRPGMLVILPAECLDVASAALKSATVSAV